MEIGRSGLLVDAYLWGLADYSLGLIAFIIEAAFNRQKNPSIDKIMPNIDIWLLNILKFGVIV